MIVLLVLLALQYVHSTFVIRVLQEYIYKRGDLCWDTDSRWDEFRQLGKLNDKLTTLANSLARKDLSFFETPGIFQFDLFQHMIKEHKLSSNTLNNVSFEFLGERKVDMKPQEMFAKFKGSDDDRRDIGIYCVQVGFLYCAISDALCDTTPLLHVVLGMVTMSVLTSSSGAFCATCLPHRNVMSICLRSSPVHRMFLHLAISFTGYSLASQDHAEAWYNAISDGDESSMLGANRLDHNAGRGLSSMVTTTAGGSSLIACSARHHNALQSLVGCMLVGSLHLRTSLCCCGDGCSVPH